MKRIPFAGFASVGAVFTASFFLALACSSSNFKGNKNTSGRGVPENNEIDGAGNDGTDVCTDCKTGSIGGASGDVRVAVQSLWFNSDSWFKNCARLEIDTQSIELGCNKDSDRKESFEFTIPTAASTTLKNSQGLACVPVNIVVASYRNLGSTCVDNLPATCNGPYGTQADFVRSVKNNPSLFKQQRSAAEVPEMVTLNESILQKISSWFAIPAVLNSTSTENNSAVVTSSNRLVSFFEDKGEAAVAASITTQEAQLRGVDFNDTIIAIDSGSVLLETGVCQ
jgi:hypothetical protein